MSTAPPAEAIPTEALARAIADAWNGLSRAQPRWQLTEARYTEEVYQRLASVDATPARQLELFHRLKHDDLHHAIACLAHCNKATTDFYRRYDPTIRRACALALPRAADFDDVVQDVRTSLLVTIGDEGGPPKLASYRGEGGLDAWLKIVVRRRAIDHGRQGLARERNVPPAPPIDHDREQHMVNLDVARILAILVREELAKLPIKQRGLILKRFRDRMKLHEISDEAGVVISTVSRRISSLVDDLYGTISTRARAEHGLEPEDLSAAIAHVARTIRLDDLLVGLGWLMNLLTMGARNA